MIFIEAKDIDNIRAHADIVDIISSYIKLEPKGKNYFGVCPFHDDHSPSMSVSKEKQIYNCFVCKNGGNVFTFVMNYENVSFLEAVKIVADKIGMPFDGVIKTPKKVNNKKELEIMDLALKFYQNNLSSPLGVNAKKYLNDRAINEEMINTFDLGLALDKTHSLASFLTASGYDNTTLQDLGLVKDTGGDIFANRIMFPIHDLDGNCVGFTARIYNNAMQAKYLNSKESIIFKKGKILYNYHRARSEIRKSHQVIIVEGNMDAIRLFSSGVKNVVALMGTSLTDTQVDILKDLRSQIILMLDNDDAGEAATYQNGNILKNAGLTPIVVRLSGEKDPDSYIIRFGIEAIKDNIKNAQSFLDFELNYLRKNKDLKNTKDISAYIKEVMNTLKQENDIFVRELTIKNLSGEFGISLDTLNNELDKISIKEIKPKPQKKLAKMKEKQYDIVAQEIIYYMMCDSAYINKFQKDLGFFTEKKYRNIASEIIYYYETNGNINITDFVSSVVGNEELSDEVSHIIGRSNGKDVNSEEFDELINLAVKLTKKEQIKKLKEEINQEVDADAKLRLAEKLLKLKKDV